MEKDQEFNYRLFLKRELNARKARNAAYSLRSFARDLGMPSSKLSEVLNSKCGLSQKSAEKLANKLNLSEEEKNIFIQLVLAEHSRSHTARTLAKSEVLNLKNRLGYTEIDLERFKIIADWYHFAILELTEITGFQPNASWISKRLKIGLSEAKSSVRRLFDFGLLKETPLGQWKQTQIHLATPSGLTSRVVRDHHLQILKRAEIAIADLPTEAREISSTTLAINTEKLDEARKYLKDFRRKFCKDMQSTEDKNRVYNLAIQFFPLDNE